MTVSKPVRTITISLSPELYSDLKTVAFVRYMNGSAQESLGDAFLCKLFYLLDKGVESHHFKYKKEKSMHKDNDAFCPCEECQKKREAWTALQPPMIEELPEEDAEDEVCQG